MKNFSEATAISPLLDLSVDLILDRPAEIQVGSKIVMAKELKIMLPINQPISMKIVGLKEIIKFTIDDITIPNHHWCQTSDVWTLNIPNFYPWYHAVTGQGWVA